MLEIPLFACLSLLQGFGYVSVGKQVLQKSKWRWQNRIKEGLHLYLGSNSWHTFVFNTLDMLPLSLWEQYWCHREGSTQNSLNWCCWRPKHSLLWPKPFCHCCHRNWNKMMTALFDSTDSASLSLCLLTCHLTLLIFMFVFTQHSKSVYYVLLIISVSNDHLSWL